jgi:hypothetical protein
MSYSRLCANSGVSREWREDKEIWGDLLPLRGTAVWTFLEGSAQKITSTSLFLRSSPSLLIHGPKWPKKHSPGFTLG